MDDLDALFEKDPLKLTDADLDQIIAWLRQERKKWLKGPPPKKPKTKKAPTLDLDLGPLAIKKG